MKKKTRIIFIFIIGILLGVVIAIASSKIFHEIRISHMEVEVKDWIPSVEDTGKEIILDDVAMEQINEIIKYANAFYSSEWDQETLNDIILANVGFAITQDEQKMVKPDDYKLGIEKEIFEEAIYNFFGKNLEEPERLDTGMISFENGYYMILPMGIGEEGVYDHKFLKAYNLKNGYIKIECSVDYTIYDILTDTDIFEKDVGRARCILKKTAKSTFGYNVISYDLKVDM